MDDVVNRFARELADAIAAAVAENPQVEACREKARAAGFEMKVTLEAVVGFVSRSQTAALTKVAAPARVAQPKRALVKYLDNVSDAEITELNIPTGIPLVYELDANLKPIGHAYLGDPAAAAAAAARVAAQTKST